MDITVKNLQSKFPVLSSHIKTAVLKVCKELRLLKQKSEISVVFVSRQRMRSINKKYLGHDYVTDVITFDYRNLYAEIIICPSAARANAKKFKTSMEKELILYVIHGLLHLAGYDDRKPKDIQRMRLKEKQLLDRLV